MLVLDEATSALDPVTEKEIQAVLDKIMGRKTCIVIAHRLSTLINMDRILVFKDGKVVEEGSHKSLLRKKGHYAYLWAVQMGKNPLFKN
jgi:ATP-binding cassette subfamily B protein